MIQVQVIKKLRKQLELHLQVPAKVHHHLGEYKFIFISKLVSVLYSDSNKQQSFLSTPIGQLGTITIVAASLCKLK
jgi:hypothetical protein